MSDSRCPQRAALGLMALSLALAACDTPRDRSAAGERPKAAAGDSTPPVSSGMAMSAAAHSTAEKQQSMALSERDDWITVRSVSALRARPELGSGIHVSTTSGHVVLSGTTASKANRDIASSLVQAVDGVIQVENQISIQ